MAEIGSTRINPRSQKLEQYRGKGVWEPVQLQALADTGGGGTGSGGGSGGGGGAFGAGTTPSWYRHFLLMGC